MPIIGGRQIGVRGLGFQGAGKPNQVTGLTATDFGTSRAYNDGRIDLSWTAPADNGAPITGYRIERSTDNISYSAISVNTGTTSTTYTDTGLNSAQVYYYKVAAINAVDTGTLSDAANTVATTIPDIPSTPTATRTNDTTVSLAFTVNDGGSVITSYTVTSSPSISLSVSGTSSPISVTGSFALDTNYTFTIAAVNANGASVASSPSSAIKPNPPFALLQTFNSSGTYTVPNNVSSLAVFAIGGGLAGNAGNAPTRQAPPNANLWAFGGNGGNGGSGGSGAGGFINSTTPGTNYVVTIGGSGGGTSSFGSALNSTGNGNASSKTNGNGSGSGGNGGNGAQITNSANTGTAGNTGKSGGNIVLSQVATVAYGGGGGGGGGGSGSNGNGQVNNTSAGGGAGGSIAGASGGSGGNGTYSTNNYTAIANSGAVGSNGSQPGGGGGGGGGGGAYGGAPNQASGNGGNGGSGGSGRVLVYGK